MLRLSADAGVLYRTRMLALRPQHWHNDIASTLRASSDCAHLCYVYGLKTRTCFLCTVMFYAALRHNIVHRMKGFWYFICCLCWGILFWMLMTHLTHCFVLPKSKAWWLRQSITPRECDQFILCLKYIVLWKKIIALIPAVFKRTCFGGATATIYLICHYARVRGLR